MVAAIVIRFKILKLKNWRSFALLNIWFIILSWIALTLRIYFYIFTLRLHNIFCNNWYSLHAWFLRRHFCQYWVLKSWCSHLILFNFTFIIFLNHLILAMQIFLKVILSHWIIQRSSIWFRINQLFRLNYFWKISRPHYSLLWLIAV